MSKQTLFDKTSLKDPAYKDWLKVGSRKTTFKCKVCEEKNKEQTLGDMGVGVIKKHMATDGHKDKMKCYQDAIAVFQRRKPVNNDAVVADNDNMEPASASSSSSTSPSNLIAAHFNATSGTNAEIIWVLNCVVKGYSDRSNDDFGDILRAICPTSPEAKCFKIGRNKLKYVVNHDLCPYFREELDRDIDKSPFITIMFDESLNEIVQQSEMDEFVCFWDIDRHKASSQFYDSRFLGHMTHLDVFSSLEDSVKKIDATRMIQVSMDGPNTNLKVLEEYQKKMVEGELPQLIDIGTYNLHTVHGAFKTGATQSGLNLKKLLKGAHRILRDTPARREDYFNLTGCSKFLLPFVATRWVEGKVYQTD